MSELLEKFKLEGKVAIITGGAGLLGCQHAEAIAEVGGTPILWDINSDEVLSKATELEKKYKTGCEGMTVDITDSNSIKKARDAILLKHHQINILINNAANDPKATANSAASGRLENFSIEDWQKDLDVGLMGAFLCSQIIGMHMESSGMGVILNIASDLGVIAPDQRIYRQQGLQNNQQPTKPVTYSVIKHGLIGLTKYLAVYWVDKNIRVNSLSPGGVYTNQSEEFVDRLTNLIPMGRMAKEDEYKAAVLFLISDASSYMTGANLVIDGGRTSW